jgi:hypothetical protein
MRRRGIALLITIAFITAIAALIAIAGGILQQGFDSARHKGFLIQSNVMLSNIYTLLHQNTAEVKDADTLDILLNMPLFFSNKQSGISAGMTFTSDADTVNINRLLSSSAPKADGLPIPLRGDYENYLDRILAYYNVSDPFLLISLIADTLDKDTNERVTGSEIALEDPDFTQGHIYNLHQFRRILAVYERETRDFSVEKVPWNKLIGFRNDDIDFNHVTPETLRFMLPGLAPSLLTRMTTGRVRTYAKFEELPLSPVDIKVLQAFNVNFYDPAVQVNMSLFGDKQKVSYTFVYNLSKHEASYFAIAD